MTNQFPENFVFGAATSCYQIEGATAEDGRGESIWDRFCAVPGKVVGGESGAVACDHYHRWREDVALMAELELQAYRFSLAWPRILPGGGLEEAPLKAGLDFYDRLTDALLEAGVAPWATLYHWDLPQALQDRGGWPVRATADAFARFADIASARLGDRVRHWITHNEPWVVSMLGHLLGEHAPGRKDWGEALAAAHHVLLSHGLAAPLIRANAPGARVGITLNLSPAWPASDSDADADAARRFDGWFNRWFLDPVFGRGYPADMLADYRRENRLPADWDALVRPGDLEAVAAPIDFLGVNFYNRKIVRSDKIPEEQNAPRTVFPEAEHTDMGWEVHAPSLKKLLLDLTATYAPPALVVTENGAAYDTPPGPDGSAPDARRVQYFRDHLVACREAVAGGAPLAGYFAWSLMDNFEWAHGYAKRFGMVWVDYETQRRIPKDSARWYREVIRRRGV